MWYEFFQMLMLAQTEQEKRMTYMGLFFFGFFLFVLVLDTLAKGKLFPKKGPLKTILIFMCIVVFVVVIFLYFYNK